MSLTGRLQSALRAWLAAPETRSSLENPSTPLSYPAEWLLDIFNGGRTDSGLRVSEMTALQVSTVYACIHLIASAIGFLPLHVFEWVETADKRPGKKIAPDHDAYDLLRYEPNPEMTAFSFRKTLQAHALLWGNCYAEIQRDNANRAVALWPRNPARTRPYRVGQPTAVAGGDVVPTRSLVYKTTEGIDELTETESAVKIAGERVIAAADMLHIPGLSLDGRLGQSVIQLARQAVGLALATEKYGAKYFGNGARPGGVLTHPGHLEDKALEQLRRSWAEAQGGENVHRVAILEEGMKFEASSSENEAAQFLQTRQFQKSEICSIFAVPPHMIGDTEKQNRANTEQIGLEFVTFTLGPWLEAWTQEIKRKIFPKLGRTAGKFFPKFETRQLTMPDAEARRNFYATLKQWGIGSTNDVREFEDMNPIDDPGADALWMPVNMTTFATESPAEVAPGTDLPPAAPTPSQAPAEKLSSHLIRAYLRIFSDAMRRILSRRAPSRAAFEATFEPILASIADQFRAFDPALEGKDLDLSDYLDSFARRSATWASANGEFDRVAADELERAVRAVAVELYRAAGAARARELTEAPCP